MGDSFLHLPKFWYYNFPTMRQANNAEGNVSVDGNYVNGILHTLSVWENKKAMTKFYRSGPHAQAMKMTGSIAESNTVYGYETDKIPSWEEALTIWTEKGREIRFHKKRPAGETTKGGGGGELENRCVCFGTGGPRALFLSIYDYRIIV